MEFKENMNIKKILLISLDAMVQEDIEYLMSKSDSNFRKIMGDFARVEQMQSVYPSLTYPAHFSIASGCNPGKTGFYENFYLPFRTEGKSGWIVESNHCPVEDFSSEEKYDVILCTHAFPYFPEKDKILKKMANLCKKEGRVIIANSSTNSLKDLIINFGLKATTSKAKYLSVEEMKKLMEGAGLQPKDISIIRERFYMPTIALFDSQLRND